MDRKEPISAAGQARTIRFVVEERHLASALASEAGEAYPPLLSTPSMVAAMERACASLLRPALADGEASVGVRIEGLEHLAPTPKGIEVAVRAAFVETRGAVHWFDVEASDPGGIVGRARHSRAVVKLSRLMERAVSRTSGA